MSKSRIIGIAFYVVTVCVCVRVLSCVRLFEALWTVALPGSSVHEIPQARILEWVAISFPRASF